MAGGGGLWASPALSQVESAVIGAGRWSEGVSDGQTALMTQAQGLDYQAGRGDASNWGVAASRTTTQTVAAFVEEIRLDEHGIAALRPCGPAALRPRPAFIPVLAVSRPAKREGMVGERWSLTGAAPLAEWSWRRVEVLGLENHRGSQSETEASNTA